MPELDSRQARQLDERGWMVNAEHPALTRRSSAGVTQSELAFIAGAITEKLDGSGYPDNLRARDLPLEARILAVADVYGALTEDRPYRRGFAPGSRRL